MSIFFTANEKDNPDLRPAQVRSDMRKFRDWFGGATVGGFQEINDPSDKQAITLAFPKPYVKMFSKFEVPIIFNGRYFKLMDSFFTLGHTGKAGVSPNRYFTGVLLKRKFRPWIKPFWFINTHMVSKPHKDDWRSNRWNMHWVKMGIKISSLVAAGNDVILVGDFNKTVFPKIHPRQVVLSRHGLDHIILIPSSEGNRYIYKDSGWKTRGLFTDHPAVWCKHTIARRLK